ncbi:MAG: hypothetical protein ACK4XH_11850 [Microcystis sp.]|uniref:hypothetical protein n=1 Tax=Microcystis sp. TaxID=1127 RepID=UPI003918A37E
MEEVEGSGTGGEDSQYSDRANCASEDNTSQRDRFEVSCKIHGQFWANSTSILPPPPILSNITFLSPENRFLKETRFLSAIAGGRSGLGYL